MGLTFSAKAGCWERHLRRQYRNPLFDNADDAIGQSQLDQARVRDEQEQRQFMQDFQVLLQDSMGLQDNADNDVILQLKERVDRLYLQCITLTGDRRQWLQGLLKLHDAIVASLRKATADDPVARDEIEQEQEAHRLHRQLLQTSLVADLLRADSPIGEQELVPSLLSEPEDSLRVVLSLFDATQLDVMCHGARALLQRLQQEGCDRAEFWSRLALLEGYTRTLDPDQTLQ